MSTSERTLEELKRRIVDLEKREAHLTDREEALRQAHAQLVHEEKMSSLGRLVAGIAHELNNPINFIYGNVEFLGQYFEGLMRLCEVLETPDLPATIATRVATIKQEIEYEYLIGDARKLLSSIRSGAERTAAIVRDLKNFSHGGGVDLKETDLVAGIETTLNLIQPLIKGRIKVEREFDAALPRVLCHAGRINQVFMNILTNAAQAIAETGTIRICACPIEFERVRVTITDTGRGIAPEHLDKITDPFFTTKEVGEGTGLGLWISESIVHAHGGRLECKSMLGQGSTFIVELPIQPSNG